MCQITPETSKRICSHMNEDHGVSIYAMVLSALDQNDKKQNKAKEDNPMIKNMKISNCILKSVSLTQMKLSFVACDNDNGICMSRDLMIDFDPPLKSSAEIRLVKACQFQHVLCVLYNVELILYYSYCLLIIKGHV